MPNEFDAALATFRPDPEALKNSRLRRRKSDEELIREGYEEQSKLIEEQAKEQARAEEEMARERERRAKEQARMEEDRAKADIAAANDQNEPIYRRAGRPTYTDSAGRILPVDDDATWAAKQQEKRLEEEQKAQAKADAAFRKSEAVRLNQAENRLESGLDTYKQAGNIASQAVQAKAGEIMSLSQAHKAASDDALPPAQRNQITNTPEYQQWLAGQPPEIKSNPFAISDYLAERIHAARKEKEALENNERTLNIAKTNRELEIAPERRAIEQQRAALPITTAPKLNGVRSASVDVPNPNPTPASQDAARTAAVLRDHITVLREKGDFERAAALEKRLTQPEAWQAEQAAFRAQATPEALVQAIQDEGGQILNRHTAIREQYAALKQQQQVYVDRLNAAQADNERLLSGTYSDADTVNVTDQATGEVQKWHKTALQNYHQAASSLRQWEQQNRGQIDLLDIEQQQLAIDAANVDRHQRALQFKQREAQREQDAQRAQSLTKLRQEPGMAAFADEIEQETAEATQRAADIERKYTDPNLRKIAFQTLSEDMGKRQADRTQRMEAKRAEAARLYDWGKKLNVTDWLNEKDVSSRLRQEAEKRGLTEQEGRLVLDAARKLDWNRPMVGPQAQGDLRGGQDNGPTDFADGVVRWFKELIDGQQVAEPVRVLADGRLTVNPALHLDRKAYEGAVQAASTTPEAKQAALKQFDRLHELAGVQALNVLESEVGPFDFNDWRTQKLKTEPAFARKSLGTQANEFIAEIKARPDWQQYGDTLLRKLAKGVTDVGAMASGVAALIYGPIPGVGEYFANAGNANLNLGQALSGATSLKGGSDSFALRAGGLVAELIPQIVPMMVGGGLLTGTGRMGAVQAAALMGGMQTTGLQQASTYQNLRAQINPATGKPYTHLEAWSKAAPGAIASGIVTGMLTALGGRTGGEAAAATLLTRAGREAAKKAFRDSYSTVWKGLKTVTGHALGEYLEEAPDELFSQISEEISTKGRSANLGRVVEEWLKIQPELMAAVSIMGGGMGTAADLVNRAALKDTLLAEDVAAAETEIEGYQDTRFDGAVNDQIRSRAALALAIARGLDLNAVDESILNAAGWTRKDASGLTRADGTLSKLKDYQGPTVLEVDTQGRVKLDSKYASTLQEHMPVLAGLIGKKVLDWHTPGKIEEAAAPASPAPLSPATAAPATKPAPASSGEVSAAAPKAATQQPRGSSGQGPATPAVSGVGTPQAGAPAVSGAPAAPIDPVAQQKQRLRDQMPYVKEDDDPRPQRAWEVANHLEMAGLPRDQAERVALAHLRQAGMVGASVNEQVTSDAFTRLLDTLGATGDRTTRTGTEPLKLPADFADKLLPETSAKPASKPATENPLLAPSATPAHKQQEASLVQQGVQIHVVENEAQAEALLGAPLKIKGRKAVTALVKGKPVVVFIGANVRNAKGSNMAAVIDEEFHHAAALLVLQNNPELLAQAQAEAAGLPNGNAIYNGWNNLSPTAKVIEAAAAYAAGKWQPDRTSAIRRFLDSLTEAIQKMFGLDAATAQTAAVEAIRRLADDASALLNRSQATSSQNKPATAPKGARPEYPALRQQLAAKEISTIEALREVIRLSGERDTGVLQDLLTDHLGLKKPAAAAAVETLRSQGELAGTREDIPIASSKRKAAKGKRGQADDTFAPADTRDLPRSPAWARHRLATLAALPPRQRRWGYRYLSSLEPMLAQNAGIFEAVQIGPMARRNLGGQQVAVMSLNGQVTLLIDVPAMMRNVSDLGDPRRRALATLDEETWHAAQLHLEKTQPGKWNRDSLAQQWQDLPTALKEKVWQAYHNAGNRPLPDKFSTAEAYAMQSEFLRMLGQGLIDPTAITESVDPASGLMQSLRDLLADLYNVLRKLIAGLPPSQAQTLDQQVQELQTVRARLLQPGPPSPTALQRLQILRDPVAVGQMALQNGLIWQDLPQRDSLFSPEGLARVWDLLTPAFQRQAAQLDPALAQAKTPQAKTKRLLEILLDPDHARSLAQTLLQPGATQQTSTSVLRRILGSLATYFRNPPKATFDRALKGLDTHGALVLAHLRSLLIQARSEFEAAAGVQTVTSAALQEAITTASIAGVNTQDQDEIRANLRRTAQQSAEAMQAAWAQEAQQRAFFEAAAALAEQMMPGVSDALQQRALVRQLTGQSWEALKARMEANLAQVGAPAATAQPSQATTPLALPSPAMRSAQAIQELLTDRDNLAQQNTSPAAREEIARRLLQEEWSAAILQVAAQAERRYYANAGELSPADQRQIEALLQVVRGDLTLGWQADRRQIGTTPDSGTPIRIMGLARENALNALGITIEPDGTAWADAKAPIYIERGQILIKQSTLDDLATRLPITRRQFRRSELEQRAEVNLTGAPSPVTADSIAQANAERAQAITERRQAARLEALEQADRQDFSEDDAESGPLYDPIADPQTGRLSPGERGDLISWLATEGSLGWPDASQGGEWDWLKPYLDEYYTFESSRTRTKILKDKQGNSIGAVEQAVTGTKLGITNSHKNAARQGRLTHPGAVVEWLIQQGVLTPAVETRETRDLSPYEGIREGTGLDAVQDAAEAAGYDMSDGIGNAVLAALEARKAARRDRKADPQTALELQTLRFERDTRSGPVAVEAHQLAALAEEGPTYVTTRSPDADLTELSVLGSEWQPMDPDSREIEDYLEGHPAFRGLTEGQPERLMVTLSGGTLYGRQTVPGETILRVHDTGNTGIGLDLSDTGDFLDGAEPTEEPMDSPEADIEVEMEDAADDELTLDEIDPEILAEAQSITLPDDPETLAAIKAEFAQFEASLQRGSGLAASHRWPMEQVKQARQEMQANPMDAEYQGGRAWFDPKLQKWINLGTSEHFDASEMVHEFGYGPAMAAGFVRVTTETYANGHREIFAEFFGPPTRRLRKVMEDTAMLRGMDPSYSVHLEANAERFYGDPNDTYSPLAAGTRFYSRLEQVITAKMPNRATPELVRNLINNPQTGIKQEEIKWSGIRTWLDSQTGQISKDDVLNYLRTEGSVQFLETRLGGQVSQLNLKWSQQTDNMMSAQLPNGNEVAISFDSSGEFPGVSMSIITPDGNDVSEELVFDTIEEAMRAAPQLAHDSQQDTKARNTAHTLPGGTNQQEVVVTWKQQPTENREQKTPTPNSEGDRQHYGDLDALAWFRTNDRIDANGQPGLFVEEFQSKWHQQGRKKGYVEPLDASQFSAVKDDEFPNVWSVTYPDGSVYKHVGKSAEEAIKMAVAHETDVEFADKVPDAPYRKDWPLMLFKRALADAVAAGKAWIGWTVGDTQADRYDLSKRLSRISYEPNEDGSFDFEAYPLNDDLNPVISETDIDLKRIEEIAGKEVAKKVEAREGEKDKDGYRNWHHLRGLDLRVGGKGMRKFYDDMLVKEFGKYVKQWGSKVTKSEVASATTLSEPTWKTFDDSDWDTFGGAEPFANNDDPVIAQAQLLIDGQPRPVSVILDANGMQVIDGDGENVWMVPNTIFPGQMSEGWWQSAASAQNSAGIAWTNKTHRLWSSFDTILGEDATLAPMLGTTPIWRIDITPAMRESVAAGQALFARNRLNPQMLGQAVQLANNLIEKDLITDFGKYVKAASDEFADDTWKQVRPYLAGVWDIAATLNNLPIPERSKARQLIAAFGALRPARQPAASSTPRPTPQASPAPARTLTEDDLWKMQVNDDDSATPDPYEFPGGRRVVPRAGQEATPPASASKPAAPVAAPTNNDEFFAVIASNPDWASTKETKQHPKQAPDDPRLGPLAGIWLRKDIYKQLPDIVEHPPMMPDIYSIILEEWAQPPEKVIHNYGATLQQREQAIDEIYGPLAPDIQIRTTKTQSGLTMPHIMRGRAIMVDIEGVPHVATRQVALPSIGTGPAPGVRFLPLEGDKSKWTGHINKAIRSTFPNLDAETDLYLEPYGGGLVYLQNLDVLRRTTKPVMISVSEEFEPERLAIYRALARNDQEVIQDIRASLKDPRRKPTTEEGIMLMEKLIKPSSEENEEQADAKAKKAAKKAAIRNAFEQLPNLAALLQKPNVKIMPWRDADTFAAAIDRAKAGKRVTLFEDSNYADLVGEKTANQYKTLDDTLDFFHERKVEFIGKDAAKLLAQKLPVYRAVLEAGGTIIATNNMNPTLLGGLLAEFGDDGHWLAYAHGTRPVPDGWLRHPDGKGVLWSTERPEYLAILRKGVVTGTPKYGTDTSAGLDFRRAVRRSFEELDRAAQPHREPSPYTGGSREAAESLLLSSGAAGNREQSSTSAGSSGNTPPAKTSKPAKQEPRAPTVERTMAPLPPGAKVSRNEIGKWDALEAEQRALAEQVDNIDDEIAARIDDPDNEAKYGLKASLRQAFPGVPPPTGTEIRQILAHHQRQQDEAAGQLKLFASSRIHPITGQALGAARRLPKSKGPTFPNLVKPTLPPPEPHPKLFDEWAAPIGYANTLYGYRGETVEGESNGYGNTEGNGIYLMRLQSEAEPFGHVRKVYFPEPRRPFVVRESLYLLHESDELDKPIDTAKDSPWLQANKYAAQHAHNLGKGQWNQELAGDILTKLLMEAGYDAVYVQGMPDDWVVLLRETRPGQKPLKALPASKRRLAAGSRSTPSQAKRPWGFSFYPGDTEGYVGQYSGDEEADGWLSGSFATEAEARAAMDKRRQEIDRRRLAAGSRSTPSQALVIYRRLTTERDRLAQEGRTLTPDQAQRLEQAERQLGQVMMDFLPPPTTPALRLESEPTRTRDLNRTPTAEQLRLFASARITDPPFSTPERKALEDSRIHAIDTLLHGQRRPIAQTAPADQARSSRAQLPLLLAHLSRSRGPGRLSAPDEAARRREDRLRDKQTLIDWARGAGLLIDRIPTRFKLDGAKDKGGSEHHVFQFTADGGRWLKITRGSGESFGYMPRVRQDEWHLSSQDADIASYLEKLQIQNQVFHDDVVLHAVWADRVGNVALITSQPDYAGTLASQQQGIKPAMEAAGFIQLSPGSAYYRPSDNLAALDIHSENAVIQDNGTFLRVFDGVFTRPTGNLRQVIERIAQDRQDGLSFDEPTTLASARRTPAQTIEATGLAANQDNNSSFAGRLDAANRKVEKYQATGGAARWIVMADLGRWIDWNRYPTLDALQSAAKADFQTTRAMGSPLADALPYVSSVLKDPNQQGNPTLQALRQQHGNDPQTLAAILLPKLQAQHKAVTKANADYLVQAHADDPFFQSAMLRATMSDLGKTSVAFPVTLYPVAVAITRTAWNDGKLHSLPAMLETYQQHAKDVAEVALRSINGSKNVEGLEGGEWITLPQVPANATNAEKEAIFASWEALSHANWCTSRGMARTYAPRGKMAVYRKNGTSLLAIRFEGDDVVEVQSPNNDGTVPLEYIPEVNNYASSSSPRTQRTLAALAERSEDEAKRQQRITNKRARFLASLPINAAPEAVWDANGFIQLEDGSYAADETAENHFLPENDPRLTLLAYSESLPFASLPNLKQLSLKQMRWLDNQGGSPKDEWPSLQSLKGHIAVYSLAQVPSLTQIQGSIALSRPEKQWQAVPEPALRQLLDRHQLDTPKAAPKNYKLVKFQSEAMPNWRQIMSELESLLDQYSPKNQPSTLDWGSLNKPASLPASERLAQAAQKTNTTPTEAQKQAENYQTGKVSVHGLRLSIENPRGSVRRGTDANGKAWEITMPHHYGRILGTHGADKDHVDFFMGPDPDSPTAFVINQRKPGNGHFDEHKVMLGFTSAGLAARGYLDSYTKGWTGYQSIVPMTLDQLKHWLEHGKMDQPVTQAPVVSNDAKPLASSKRQTLPVKPDMDQYQTWKGTKEERDAEWQRWHRDVAQWEQAASKFADQQGNLGLFVSGIKTGQSKRPYRQARAVTRIPGKADQWRVTLFAQQITTPEHAPQGDWANNAWVPISHDEFATKQEAYLEALREIDKDYEFTTQPLFGGQRLPISASPRQIADTVAQAPVVASNDAKLPSVTEINPVNPILLAASHRWPTAIVAAARQQMFEENFQDLEFRGGNAWLTPNGKWINLHRDLHMQAAPIIAEKSYGPVMAAGFVRVAEEIDPSTGVKNLYAEMFGPLSPQVSRLLRDAAIMRRIETHNIIIDLHAERWWGNPENDGGERIAASPRQIADTVAQASFNHLDRKLTLALRRMGQKAISPEPVQNILQAIAAWKGKDTPSHNLVRSLADLAQRELIPETVLPREILSALRELQTATSIGQQKALDLSRAALGKVPKFSDLAFPAEYVENPTWRETMFTAMEQGKVDTLPEPLQKMAGQLRALLVEAGREAVAQGRMSPDTFEGLRTTYMPRFTKEEAEAGAGDWTKRFKLGIKDILAQRSTAFHITDTTRKGKDGLPLLINHHGRKWRFADAQARDAYYEELIQRETLDPDLGNTDWSWMTRRDSRLLHTVTPEMLKAPATMTADQRAIVARVQRQLRQQFKKEDPYEPKDLIKDPVYAVMRYLAQMTHDNATAKFFNLIEKNPDWTTTTDTAGFTQIPDSSRFGTLAGKWVRDDIANQVTELADSPNQALALYDTLLRLWKTGKTVLNPATHARNIFGNIPFAAFAGNNPLNPGNWPAYIEAFRILRQGGAEYRQLYETGVLGADYAGTELKAALQTILPGDEALPKSANPVLAQIQAVTKRAADWAAAHSWQNLGVMAGVGATAGGIAAGPLGAVYGAALGAAANRLYKAALFAYRFEDDIFKAAAFVKARQMGMTLEQSAEHVRHWFPYYDKPTSGTIRLAGRTGLPFVSFFRESGRIGVNALKERPLMLATTIAIPTLITAISQAMLGLSDDDLEDIRQVQRGKGAKLLGPTPLAGLPLFSMVLPFRTADGRLQQLDLSSTHPFADFLADRVENFNNQPWWQSWARASFANPVVGLFYTAATGKDAFNDRVVYDPTYSTTESLAAMLNHAYTTAVPPLAPGGTNWTLIEQSTRRTANKTMALRSPAQAVGRGVLGVDVRTADPDIYRLADQFRQDRGLAAAEKGVAYPTDAAGRARKALFEELIQNQPNPEQVRRHLQTLNDLGSPVRTVSDVLDILDRRRPDGVINPKALRNPFRASLNPEARRVLDQALAAFQRARANTPGAFSAARLKLNATTRRRETTED